jgi:hypothetical protein
MRKLTGQDLIAIVPLVSDNDMKRACDILAPIGLESGWLQRGLAEGIFQSATVTHNGQAVFVLFYHVSLDRTLIVNYAAGLQQGDWYAVLMGGADCLARNQNCQAIAFHSIRAGFSKRAPAFGYEPAAILWRKKLS